MTSSAEKWESVGVPATGGVPARRSTAVSARPYGLKRANNSRRVTDPVADGRERMVSGRCVNTDRSAPFRTAKPSEGGVSNYVA